MKIFSLIFVVLIVAILLYYFLVVSPIIYSLCEEKVRSLSTTIISQSVEKAISEKDVKYDDLVHITYNSNNEITLIQNDTPEINLLVRRITELVQNSMDSLGKQGIGISLGTFTGIPFLFGIGPIINIKLVPVGTVNTIFKSKFSSRGVNNVLHSLSFEISANVGMLFPSRTQNFLTTLETLVCESVIFGKVPDVYLDNSAQE